MPYNTENREYKRGLDLNLFGQTRAFDKKEAEETRVIPYVISTETKDRHGTVVLSDGWELDNFNRNPIVDFNHRSLSDWFLMADHEEHRNVIGSSSAPIVKNKELLADATFAKAEVNPKAEEIFQMVLNGFLRASSVVFVPTQPGRWGEGSEAIGKENETYYFQRQELYSWGPVIYPSNTGAGKRNAPKHLKTKTALFAYKMLREMVPDGMPDQELQALTLQRLLDFAEGRIETLSGAPSKGIEEQIARQRQRLALGF